jgi:hypothetical protein
VCGFVADPFSYQMLTVAPLLVKEAFTHVINLREQVVDMDWTASGRVDLTTVNQLRIPSIEDK